MTSVNGESANALLSKAKEKKNVKSSLTKPSLLKFMSQVYMERLKDLKKTAHIPLHVSVYEYFLNKYGLKKVAETKCLQVRYFLLYGGIVMYNRYMRRLLR